MKIRAILAAVIGAGVLSLGSMFGGGASQDALALSCAAPNLIRTLERVKASETEYYVLVGKFVSEPAQPETERETPPKLDAPLKGKVLPFGRNRKDTTTRALFEGFSPALDDGDDTHFTRWPIDILAQCTGPWCGSVPSSKETLIGFVEVRENDVPLLRVSACGGRHFSTQPDGPKVQTLRKCLGQTCSPEDGSILPFKK